MVYVVERYLPGLSRADLLHRLSRLEPVVEKLRAEGSVMRYFGSVAPRRTPFDLRRESEPAIPHGHEAVAHVGCACCAPPALMHRSHTAPAPGRSDGSGCGW
jgi:hypothetical protein